MPKDPTIDAESLALRGFTVIPGLIPAEECRPLAALWPDKPNFRSHVVMQRHGYGRGEYQYFAYPLPEPVERLRQALYPPLAEIANRWNGQLGRERRFPPTLKAWLRRCHASGQKRPTPLLLRYGPGDYNCLHRVSCPRIFWTRICPTGGSHDEVAHEPNRNQRCE